MPEEATETVVPSAAAAAEPGEVCATNHTHPETAAESKPDQGEPREAHIEVRIRTPEEIAKRIQELNEAANRVKESQPDVYTLLLELNNLANQHDALLLMMLTRLERLETPPKPARAAADEPLDPEKVAAANARVEKVRQDIAEQVKSNVSGVRYEGDLPGNNGVDGANEQAAADAIQKTTDQPPDTTTNN